MQNKSLDSTFVHFGIRKEDMQVVETLCAKHNLDYDWVKDEILKVFHQNKLSDNELSEKSVKRIIEKALQKIN